MMNNEERKQACIKMLNLLQNSLENLLDTPANVDSYNMLSEKDLREELVQDLARLEAISVILCKGVAVVTSEKINDEAFYALTVKIASFRQLKYEKIVQECLREVGEDE